MVKNLFINEMQRISDIINTNSKENKNEPEKLSKCLLSMVLFIISPISYQIDYYNLFLNYLYKILDINFRKNMDQNNISDIESLNYYKIMSIMFRLQKRFFREIDQNKLSTNPGLYNMSTKINSFSYYLFKNFPHYLLREKKDPEINIFSESEKQINFTCYISKERLKKKIGQKENFYISNLYYTFEGNKYTNLSKFENMFIYFNSKIIKWKECYLEDEKEDIRCKICEKEIREKDLAMHSYICSHKFEWKEQVTFLNEEINALLININILAVNYKELVSNENYFASPLMSQVQHFNFMDILKKVIYLFLFLGIYKSSKINCDFKKHLRNSKKNKPFRKRKN